MLQVGMEAEEARMEAEEIKWQAEVEDSEVERLKRKAKASDPITTIGRDVRRRYMEHCLEKRGRHIGQRGVEWIKSGDRAAHRGQPIADAMLCANDYERNKEIYMPIYGVPAKIMLAWRHVPKIVEVAEFRASMLADGKLSAEFKEDFERLVERVGLSTRARELEAKFQAPEINQLYKKLGYCHRRYLADMKDSREWKQDHAGW